MTVWAVVGLGDIAVGARVVEVIGRIPPSVAAERLGGCAADTDQRRQDGNGKQRSAHLSLPRSNIALNCVDKPLTLDFAGTVSQV
jgi:hypothetical protein